MRRLAFLIGALLLTGCAGYDSNGYYARHVGFDARLTTVCQTAAHDFTLTAGARACLRRGGRLL